jgi:hypothetical protein
VARRRKEVLAVIGLMALARMARDRRTQERVIVFALTVAAAVGLGRASAGRSKERLLAWDKKRALGEIKRRVEASRT